MAAAIGRAVRAIAASISAAGVTYQSTKLAGSATPAQGGREGSRESGEGRSGGTADDPGDTGPVHGINGPAPGTSAYEVPAAQKQHCAEFMTPRRRDRLIGHDPPTPAAHAYEMLDARRYHGKVVVLAVGRPSRPA
jgi:hypothetical protein